MDGALYFDEMTASRIDSLQDSIEELATAIYDFKCETVKSNELMTKANELMTKQLIAINIMDGNDAEGNDITPDEAKVFNGYCSTVWGDCIHLKHEGSYKQAETEQKVDKFSCKDFFQPCYKENGIVIACSACQNVKGQTFKIQ